MRTIVVKGTGSVKTRPDTVEIRLELSALDKDYQKSVQKESEKMEHLLEALDKAGIPKKDLKTTNYSVDARFEWRGEKNRKQVFVGFECERACYFRFRHTNEKLNTVIEALSECTSDAEFSIHFTVKDEEKIKEKLLREAVRNSAKRAAILAEAAGVALGDIQDISYNWGEINVYSGTRLARKSPMALMERERGMCYESCIEPDDIETEDTVTIIWEIH